MAYRINTSSTPADAFSQGTTTYYLVELNAEAMDSSVSRAASISEGGAVATLMKVEVASGVPKSTTLAQVTWDSVDALGLSLARGRWYTLSTTVGALYQTTTIRDDVTGHSAILFVFADVLLPPGGLGLWVNGEAVFDDARVNTTCSTTGGCTGIYTNMHPTLGGMCYHQCPLGYLSEGSNYRICTGTGQITGTATPLKCSPPPPTWLYNQQAGDGGAVLVDGVTFFNRSVDEHSVKNTVVAGPLMALSPFLNPELSVLFSLTSGIATALNQNLDSNGDAMFAVDACTGTVKVNNPSLNYYFKSQYNISVTAHVVGEAGAVAAIKVSYEHPFVAFTFMSLRSETVLPLLCVTVLSCSTPVRAGHCCDQHQ